MGKRNAARDKRGGTLKRKKESTKTTFPQKHTYHLHPCRRDWKPLYSRQSASQWAPAPSCLPVCLPACPTSWLFLSLSLSLSLSPLLGFVKNTKPPLHHTQSFLSGWILVWNTEHEPKILYPKQKKTKTLEEKPKKLPQEASKGKMRFSSLKLRTQHEARSLCLLERAQQVHKKMKKSKKRQTHNWLDLNSQMMWICESVIGSLPCVLMGERLPNAVVKRLSFGPTFWGMFIWCSCYVWKSVVCVLAKEQPQLRVSHKSNILFYFAISKCDWPIAKKKSSNYGSTPKNWRFYGKMKYLSLWPSSIGEKGRTLAKTYGIKARCYMCKCIIFIHIYESV
jgi:hypothetical protein